MTVPVMTFGNAASERLADVLGFTRVGRQIAVSVDIPAA
jgi:hypothetical protein